MYTSNISEVRDQKVIDLLKTATIMANVRIPQDCVFHITRETIDLTDPADDRWEFHLNRVTLNFYECYDSCMTYAADWRNEGWYFGGNLKEDPKTYKFTELSSPF